MSILPEPIEQFVAQLKGSKATDIRVMHDPVEERYQRFVQYWKRDYASMEEVEKNWRIIQSVAKSDSDLVSLFMLMPDRPEAQPFTAIYGRRTVDPGEENRRYVKDLDSVRAAINIIRPGKRFDELMRDASATDEALSEAAKLRAHNLTKVMSALRSLERLLEKVDSSAKSLTHHWASESAAMKNYAILCAGLNRYLAKPKHAALAFLANVNCPDVSINAQQIRDAWRHSAGKRV